MTLFSQHVRNSAYRDFPWFHDLVKLIENATLGWHQCSHEKLPKSKERWDEVDLYFLPEMKLEAKGWRSISIGQYSAYEYEMIATEVAKFPNEAHISKITDDIDIFPIVGIADNPSFCITVKPALIEHFEDFLRKLVRPYTVVTRAEVPQDVIDLLPPNHRIIKGSDATMISYDIVSTSANEIIIRVHDNSLRSPEKRSSKRSSSNSTSFISGWQSY